MRQPTGISSYEYRPFAPIRLLHVYRHADASIRGTLQNFSLDGLDCPQFTTISYVWGPQIYSRAILVDGHYFPVLDSVFSILEALCDTSAFQDEYWVWIDSICINLRDPQERASQVLLMKEIYSQSKHTIAWLGEKTAELKEGIAFMTHLAESYSEIREFNHTKNSREVPERLWLPDQWKALGLFLDLPWWKRIWTLQEYVSSQTIDLYCGSDHVSEDTLTTALTAIWHCEPSSALLRPDLWTPAWTRDRLRSWYQMSDYSNNMGIVALMAYSGACELTDPRDRIYGLLGLAKEADRAMIGRPAYADDVEEVYLRLVKSFISTYQSLDIICFAQIFRAVQTIEANEECLENDWPSWIPDWRVRVIPFVTPLMVSQTSGRHIGNFRPPLSSYDWEVDSAAMPYRAHADLTGLMEIDPQTKQLKCQGVFVDLIDGLGSALNSPDHCSTQSASPLVQSTSVWNTQRPKQEMDSVEFVTDLVRTLTLDREDRYLMFPAPPDDFRNEFLNLVHVAGTDRREFLPARCKSTCAWYDANKDLLMRGRTLAEVCLDVPSSAYAGSLDVDGAREASFASRLTDCTSPITMQRKLLVTAGGLIGMAPPHARKGDVVCVLLGCSVPVVLREFHMGSDLMFTFVVIMDPATIFQVIGTALSLGDVVVKSIMKLSSIKARYQGAPLVLSTMIGQLYIVKSALDQLGDFSSPEHRQHPRYQQLSDQIGNALDSFALLILALEQRLEQFEDTEPTAMRVKDRLAFLWNDKDMSEYSMLLDRQVNALSLLLQAMQCFSWPQQYELMCMEENIEILSLATDCSTSLIGVDDSSISFVSEDTDLISLRFDFDRIILNSKIYRQAQRSHLRESIRAGNMNARIPMTERITDPFVSQRIPEYTHETTGFMFEEVQVSIPEAPKPPAADSHGEASTSREMADTDQSSDIVDFAEHDDQSDHDTITISPKRNSDPFPTTKRRIRFRRSEWWRKSPTFKSAVEDGEATRLISARSIDVEKPRRALILGIGDSGKSTIFKAIQIHQQKLNIKSYGNILGYSLSNLHAIRDIVLDEMESLGITFDDGNGPWHSEKLKDDKMVWEDCGFQRVYQAIVQRRQSLENARFFAMNIERIKRQDHAPTEQDVIYHRVKTSGIEKSEIIFEDLTWELIDAGGTRIERNKWHYIFPSASTVLFAIDATCYSKELNEDPTVNCLDEVIKLFEGCIQSKWFLRTKFIVVFTRCDLLEDLLSICPPEGYCHEYPSQYGGSNVEHYFEYLTKRLLQLDPLPTLGRCRFVRARFDDIAAHNPAKEILDSLHQSIVASL